MEDRDATYSGHVSSIAIFSPIHLRKSIRNIHIQARITFIHDTYIVYNKDARAIRILVLLFFYSLSFHIDITPLHAHFF